MKLKLNFKNNNFFEKNTHIIIDVFEENLLWFNFFKNRKDNNQYFPTLREKSICPRPDILNSSNLKTAWNIIKQNTDYLKSQNFKLPYELPDKFNYNQELLNNIHRVFTYNAMWAVTECNHENTTLESLKVLNPFDESFVPQDLNTFLTAINNLNIAVHDLETTCTTVNKELVKKIIKDNQNIVVYIQNHADFNGDGGWLNVGKTMDAFQKSYVNNYPDVVLSEEIQGKSYLRAFIDNDDPTKLDITGRYGSYGGFFIDTTQDRKQIYESKEFNDWLNSYGLSKEDLLLEWPLGQVVESSLSLTNFDTRKFVGIDFLDD